MKQDRPNMVAPTKADADVQPLKPNHPRPTGTKEEEYKGNQKWKPRRWAWEFLKRNEKFRNACDSAREGDDEQKSEIAKDFGLKKFKDYREGFKGSSGMPTFSPNAISVKSNVSSKDAPERTVTFTLKYGQVAIMFDLEHVKQNRAALDAQIRKAINSLKRRQAQFIDSMDGASPKGRFPKSKLFLRHIRLLDLIASGHTQAKAIELLNPAQAGRTKTYVRDNTKQQIREARACATKDYLHIACLKKI